MLGCYQAVAHGAAPALLPLSMLVGLLQLHIEILHCILPLRGAFLLMERFCQVAPERMVEGCCSPDAVACCFPLLPAHRAP